MEVGKHGDENTHMQVLNYYNIVKLIAIGLSVNYNFENKT